MEINENKAPRMVMNEHNIKSNNICEKCKETTFILFMGENDLMVCERCKAKEDEPTAKISLYYTYDYRILYCPIRREYLTVDIVDLEQCGWFVRKQIMYNIPKADVFRGIYHLEYYGIFKCDLIPKSLQGMFPTYMTACPKLMCGIKTY